MTHSRVGVAWDSRLLPECGKLISGGTPNRSKSEFWGGSIPWISAKSLKQFDLRDSEERVTAEGVSNGTTLVPEGALLFVVRGMSLASQFRVGVTARPVTFNQDVRGLLPGDGIDARYLARFLRASEPRILSLVDNSSHGTKRLTSERLAEIKVPLPPLPEQRRIAAILDQAESLRAKRRSALARLDTLIQSLFLEMFGGTACKSWAERTVAEISKGIRTGPFGSQLLHSEFVESGIAVLGIDNAVQNRFVWAQPRFISEQKFRQLRRYQVSAGDVLITIMGTCGRCAVVPDDISTAINTKHLCCITLDRSQCLPSYLHACLLLDPRVLRRLGVRERGAVMPGLNMQVIKELPIAIPPLPLQSAFAAQVVAVEKLKSSHRASLAKLDALFASLQHRAFRGEL